MYVGVTHCLSGLCKASPKNGALEDENGQPKKLLAEQMLENGSEFTSMAILKWVQDEAISAGSTLPRLKILPCLRHYCIWRPHALVEHCLG
jgi:hypothetical protein